MTGPHVYALEALPSDLPPLVVAIGIFDGVHRGHQALLAAAVDAASEIGAVPAVLTFDPHPTALFVPAKVPPLITTFNERVTLLCAYGAQVVIAVRFDAVFAAQTPDDFARRVLAERLRARAVVVGDDFRYGQQRSGDAGLLRASGERLGFAVHVVAPVLVDGVPARSTVIREKLARGEVAEAARLLGRPFALSGIVAPPITHASTAWCR